MIPIKTADIYDEHETEARVPSINLRDFGAKKAFKGMVCTVKCFEDNSKIKEMSLQQGNGKVLVVDGGGSYRCALMGDIIGGSFMENGWAGIIINGCVRDSVELGEMEIGIKALGTIPRKSNKRGEGVAGVEIEFGGVVICEGDQIYADQDGIIVLSK